jgi:hypothetical protein
MALVPTAMATDAAPPKKGDDMSLDDEMVSDMKNKTSKYGTIDQKKSRFQTILMSHDAGRNL